MNSNTIVMRLLEKEVARSRGLFQYDYGQRLVFTGVELPDAYEVHFSNNKVGVSKTVIGDATGVDIPDEFLLKGDPVYVWVFLHTGDADGETEYHGVIDVIKRAKPVHDKPTPVQQDEITQAIAVLNAAVGKTGQDVIDTTAAKDAAEAAQAAAEEAQGIAEGARDEAVQAKNEAVSAEEAAEAAKDAAVEAKETSEEIAEALPGTIEAALQEAKDSGEFDGATFVPSIDDGVISWTNDRQLPNPEPVDIAEELELDTYAKKDEIPTKVSELTNDSGYLTAETDPTVSTWAKQPNKPSYTAQEVGAIDVAQKGTANGVAELDADGKVKSGQLPSYVDDVAEYDSMSQFPATGESGKIYIAKDTNITYRWGGSSYVPIGSDLALGETASTAYRGDRGKIAYDHASAKGNAYANGLYKIATNAEGHVTGATPVVKSDITGLGIPGSVPTKTSELQNDSGFITTETDPTVASWAKEPTKPTYTASEVGLGNVANELQYSANNPPPADTTKQDKINVNGILKGTGNGGVTAAVEGTDYISGDIIAVQDETPTDPNTQIWLPETQPESVQVASYEELTGVLNALNQSNAATNSDIGKAHSPKTVDENGHVTEWQYVPVGGSVDPIIEDIIDAVTREVKSKNLIDPSKLIAGKIGSSGGIASSGLTTYKTLDYTWLEPGSYIFAREKLADGTANAMGYSGYCLYDSEKVFISGSYVWDNFSAVTIPITITNACYIRLSGGKDYFTDNTTALFILQEGTALDGYEAYHAPTTEVIALTQNDIEQESGQQTKKVMSQKAATDFAEASLDPVMPYVVGKNKYNPADCNPENEKYYDSNGAVRAAANYAITGKIPVEANTTYTFSATSFSTEYAKPYYYSGENGETFISTESSSRITTFTTPENCTFVGIRLFARTHTEQDFNDAMAVAQLEIGNIKTVYEPYEKKRMVPPERIVGGDQITAIAEVIETASLINLYDKNIAQNGKYFYQGTEVSSNAYAYTGKIPVKPNTQYVFSNIETASSNKQLSTAVYMFDYMGAYLRMATLKSYVYSYALSFSTDSDVYFVACNMSMGEHTQQDFEEAFSTIMLTYGTARPYTYVPYNPEAVLLHDKFDDAYFRTDPFAGKRWLACGTSITWYDSKKYQAGVHTDEVCRGYVGNVARRKKLLVTNEGISGSTLADVSESSLINRYQSLDWANTDIATLEYGVNDFGHAVDIGTESDAPGTTTFAACLKTIIEYALAQNPKICLVICTEPDVRGSTPNSGGHYLYEYTDVTLAIAKQYRLPVCDWYYHGGINAVNKGSSSVDYMTADGTHPNDAGHLRMGAMLNQVFDSLIC